MGEKLGFSIFYLFILVDRFIQQKLGGPSVSEYEKLQAEMSDLQLKYNELLAAHQENCKEVIFIFRSVDMKKTSYLLHQMCGIVQVTAVGGMKLNTLLLHCICVN